MIQILPTRGLQDGEMPLGGFCELRIVRKRPSIQTRWFLNHNQLWNVEPLRGWSHQEDVKLFPEAPGTYRLSVQWRDDDGSSGWAEQAFRVRPVRSSFQPSRVTVGGGAEYWAPNANEAAGIAAYESALLAALPELVSPGDVVYDIGANIGLYAVPLSRAVGESGRIVCFEPNPVCVAYLQANLERNRCHNTRVLPVAVTGGEERVPFTINFANTLLGLSHDSAFYHHKVGQEVTVPGNSLDALAAELDLPEPAVMKIDVEGAEHVLLPGMEGTLERLRPTLLFELHGEAVAGAVLPVLDRLGYRYRDAETDRRYATGPDLLADFGPGVRQVICRADRPS